MSISGGKTEFPFLCVDEFLRDVTSARALTSAFELGLIDFLMQRESASPAAIQDRLRVQKKGLWFLLDILRANRVIAEDGDRIVLHAEFRAALLYRDLLETRLTFANAMLLDFHERFTQMLAQPGVFMRQSRIFELFCYDRCFEASPQNVMRTRHWMQVTTVLAKYESQACIMYYDFSGHRRLLDIGGNSGEFMLRVLKAHPGLEAAVLDLPVVCDIGREHAAKEPESPRIRFIQGDALNDEIPEDYDLIAFKSFLHDWPEKEAMQVMAKAGWALEPGGTLLIFEREPIAADQGPLPYYMIPNMLYQLFYRPAQVYVDQLMAMEFQDIRVQRIQMEMPFQLITGRKRK